MQTPESRWKQRFSAPQIAWSQIASRNPARGLVCSNGDGAYQLYAWDVPSGQLRQLTTNPRGTLYGAISADGERVYYLHDAQGGQVGHFFEIPYDDGPAYDYTPMMSPYTSFYIAESCSGRFVGFMALNQDGYQVFAVDRVNGGAPHIRYESEAASVGPLLSYDGEIGVIASDDGQSQFALEAYDTITGQKMGEIRDRGASIEPVCFSPLADDFRLLATTTFSGTQRPLIWNPYTRERRDLPFVTLEGDVAACNWSPDARQILLRHTYHAQQRLYVYTLDDGELRPVQHPDGAITEAYFVNNDHIFALWQNAATPPQIIDCTLLPRNVQSVARLENSFKHSEAPVGKNWHSVNFNSSDGTDVQAWLVVPDGKGPAPTLIHLHGGPTDVQLDTFQPFTQMWVDNGFAVCSVNYRGSTTFGKSFERAIMGNIGQLEVEDIVACAKYLMQQDIARKNAMFLYGAAYGGYLTLQALSTKPEFWVGGIALDGIAEWGLFYEDTTEALRVYQDVLFGGKPWEKSELYRKASPITHIENIIAPLLILHNEADGHAPARQMQAFIAQLDHFRKQYEIQWYKSGETPNTLYERMLLFSATVLNVNNADN